MGRILDALTTFFDADEWPWLPIDGKPALRLSFHGRNGEWPCFVHVREDLDQFIFHSVPPLTVPEAKRPNMAEFITRANYGLAIGNFEMDYADGEIRFKTGLDIEGTELTDGLIRGIVYANVSTTDRYIPGLMHVLYDDLDPAIAVAQVEDEED